MREPQHVGLDSGGGAPLFLYLVEHCAPVRIFRQLCLPRQANITHRRNALKHMCMEHVNTQTTRFGLEMSPLFLCAKQTCKAAPNQSRTW